MIATLLTFGITIVHQPGSLASSARAWRGRSLGVTCSAGAFTFEDRGGSECRFLMPVDDELRAKQVVYKLSKDRLTLGVDGATSPVIDDEQLWAAVDTEMSFWEIDEVNSERCVVVNLVKRSQANWNVGLMSQFDVDRTITTRTFFDITVDGEPAGRIVMGLYGRNTPRTTENFRCLCTNERGATVAKTHFKGTPFHRIIPGFMLQGGDTTMGDGTGGVSIYGRPFEDEDFGVAHDRAGLLSMANAGPDSNGSQFFITCAETPWLDGKHVVFGEVVEGMELVKTLEGYGGVDEGKPSKQIIVADCGEIERTPSPSGW